VTGRRRHIAGTHGGDSGSGGAVLGARVVRNILAETVEVTHLVLAGLDGELIEMLPTTDSWIVMSVNAWLHYPCYVPKAESDCRLELSCLGSIALTRI
jgi:hypothetical protein